MTAATTKISGTQVTYTRIVPANL